MHYFVTIKINVIWDNIATLWSRVLYFWIFLLPQVWLWFTLVMTATLGEFIGWSQHFSFVWQSCKEDWYITCWVSNLCHWLWQKGLQPDPQLRMGRPGLRMAGGEPQVVSFGDVPGPSGAGRGFCQELSWRLCWAGQRWLSFCGLSLLFFFFHHSFDYVILSVLSSVLTIAAFRSFLSMLCWGRLPPWLPAMVQKTQVGGGLSLSQPRSPTALGQVLLLEAEPFSVLFPAVSPNLLGTKKELNKSWMKEWVKKKSQAITRPLKKSRQEFYHLSFSWHSGQRWLRIFAAWNEKERRFCDAL
jgi:hypothetical protein